MIEMIIKLWVTIINNKVIIIITINIDHNSNSFSNSKNIIEHSNNKYDNTLKNETLLRLLSISIVTLSESIFFK